mgnify:CR=1 FL=1
MHGTAPQPLGAAPAARDRDAGDLARRCALAALLHLMRHGPGADAAAYADTGVEPLLLDALGGADDPDRAIFPATAALDAAEALLASRAPIGDLAAALALGPAALASLCVIGEVERSHLVCMTVAALQAPARQARPTRHLCEALAAQLAPAVGTDADPLGTLAAAGVIEPVGEGPEPLRALRIAPPLWADLLGRPAHWPHCRTLPAPAPELLPRVLATDWPDLAARVDAADIQCLVLRGGPGSGRGEAAAHLAGLLGRTAVSVPPAHWAETPALRLAAALARRLVVLRPTLGPGEALTLPEPAEPHLSAAPTIVLLGEHGSVTAPGGLELTLPLPNRREREALWQHRLGGPESGLATALAVNRLAGPAIAAIARQARAAAARAGRPVALADITAVRHARAADGLRLLAEPLSRPVPAAALVLPAALRAGVDEVVLRARRREDLWDDLGPTLAATPSPGVRALFVGESGTGKTLAATHIATRLGAPLFRVDLSAVMNKYIGESEKNLGQLLDRAAAADVVLLFDEADAVFGRRSDGKDTGERYANMLTDFLLTRIETHPGIVLLTTNSRERIDPAFTRRLDVILEFPLPGFDERLALWQSHLGERAPGAATCRFLASTCELSGGQIRNAVLTAVAHAPPAGPLSQAALYQGLAAEYRKQGRAEPAKLIRWGAAAPAADG